MSDQTKKIAAERAVDYIQDGMVVGLGTGSTAYWAIQKIGVRVQEEGLEIRAIATSIQSEQLAKELGIPLVSFAEIEKIDVTIDGADEVDRQLNLIKGGGGALLREKIVAAASDTFIVVADESKLVEQLGKFPLPVEIVPFGYERTLRVLQSLQCEPKLRMSEHKLYQTDNGNYIADCHFHQIEDPEQLHQTLQLIPGVVDNGLFVRMASKVIIGYANGEVKEFHRS